MTLLQTQPQTPPVRKLGAPGASSPGLQIGLILLVWASIYLLSLSSPPLLDDADATHAQAAQAMLRSGDWVTLHVDGIRYLEKPPLPYWIAALSLRAFGNNSFAVHLPLALTVLGLAALAWHWGRRAFGAQAGFYAALFILTSTGTFLFTRVFIPDALLSLLLAGTLYTWLRSLEPGELRAVRWALAGWLSLAAAVLTKGIVALVFLLGTTLLYLGLTHGWSRWRSLSPAWGSALFLAVAAPWHILAGLRNHGGANGHGFFWFYFVNEHVLRFLGRRTPPDYNKLPTGLYWSLHLVWLFPWSFFAPLVLFVGWRSRKRWLPVSQYAALDFRARSVLVLTLFSSLVLLFFSLSTNQEYYTLPVYLPLLLLTAAALTRYEDNPHADPTARRTALSGQAALALIGLLAATALAYELWISRTLPAAPDIGELFKQRGIGSYTLSMSHFFDLTAASFSALRLPAVLACIAFACGPLLSLSFRLRERHTAATLSLVFTSTLFLIAAHLAFTRFAPMLSSAHFAEDIENLRNHGRIEPDTDILLFGDQALGSSIPFYLHQQVGLVEGRSTSMLFGSTFPDAPHLFLTHEQLLAAWGEGRRKLLFVPLEHRAEVDVLLGAHALKLDESAGKELLTDRPLDLPAPLP